MKNLLIIIVLSLVFCISAYSQPDTLWTKTFGKTGNEAGSCVQQTTDQGFIITGATSSLGQGYNDILLLKTDESGLLSWFRIFGGSSPDHASCVQQTLDGGYIIVGTTSSYGAGDIDVYLIKTNEYGYEQWSRTFGGTASDAGSFVQQTSDGGYIIVGSITSIGTGVDIYLIKTDEYGNESWSRVFGGLSFETGECVQQTTDGGYIITGYTTHGAGDFVCFLLKTDENGHERWFKTFGSASTDYAKSVKQTTDSGYIISGYSACHDNWDIHLIKTDENGDDQWIQIFGGDGMEYAECVDLTEDGGYIVAGKTTSYGAGLEDVYVIKTDQYGNELWVKIIGGNENDRGEYIQQINDGGYIITGPTFSFGAGGHDVYLIRLDSEGSVVEGFGGNQSMSFALNPPHPNPFNQRVALDFALPSAAPVKLTVYDIQGREVEKLVEREMSPGYHEITWDAEGISSGVYFAVLNAGEYTQTQKMVLMK